MLRTDRAGKGPGDCVWGVGFRLNRTEGTQVCPPHLVSIRGQGTSPGSPADFLGSSGQGQTPSSPASLVPEGPSCLPLLISLASLLRPQ